MFNYFFWDMESLSPILLLKLRPLSTVPPPVQGSSASQSLNSLDGSKIEPLCQAASGVLFPTPSSLPPLFG